MLPYKKKMNFYLRNHLDNKIISKIRNNEKISPKEINELQQVLFNDLNSNANEFNLNYNNESLILLVRKTVGLSKEAVDREFAKYINENEIVEIKYNVPSFNTFIVQEKDLDNFIEFLKNSKKK